MQKASLFLWSLMNLILAVSGLSACSLMQRSSESGYARNDRFHSHLAYQEERRAQMQNQAAYELGLVGTRDLSSEERKALGLRMQLTQAERQVTGRREREQYFKHRPLMKDDRDRLEFLNLPSYEARARWLERNQLDSASPQHPPEIQKLIELNDITLGMTKQAVRESWGEPELVEVAGNPIYGNERWKYLQEVSSPDGYQTEARTIYFESGRVAGWEKN